MKTRVSQKDYMDCINRLDPVIKTHSKSVVLPLVSPRPNLPQLSLSVPLPLTLALSLSSLSLSLSLSCRRIDHL